MLCARSISKIIGSFQWIKENCTVSKAVHCTKKTFQNKTIRNSSLKTNGSLFFFLNFFGREDYVAVIPIETKIVSIICLKFVVREIQWFFLVIRNMIIYLMHKKYNFDENRFSYEKNDEFFTISIWVTKVVLLT